MKTIVAVLLAVSSVSAAADDRAEYNRRAAAADFATFRALDGNGDGLLTRDESRGDLNLGPRFDDIDINRDGVITPEEMRRYIERSYGAAPGA